MSSKDAQTRKKICTTFIALLSQMPYHKINVSLLASRANVSRTAFYSNYKSLDDVVVSIYDYSFQSVYQDKFMKPGYILSSEYVRDTIDYYDRFSVFLLAMEQQETAKYYHRLVSRRMFAAFQADDPLLAEHMQYYQAFFLSPIFHVCMLWIQKGKKESPQEMMRICECLYERTKQFAAAAE